MKKLLFAVLCSLALINSTTVQAIRTDGASWPTAIIHDMQQQPVRSACLASVFTSLIGSFVVAGGIIVSAYHDDYQEKTLILRVGFGSFVTFPLYLLALKLLATRSRRLRSDHTEMA